MSASSAEVIERLRSRGFSAELDAVCMRHGVAPEDVCGRARSRTVAAARADLWKRLRATTQLSYPELGLIFDRAHCTIIFAVNPETRAKKLFQSAQRWRTQQTARKQRIYDGVAALRVI